MLVTSLRDRCPVVYSDFLKIYPNLLNNTRDTDSRLRLPGEKHQSENGHRAVMATLAAVLNSHAFGKSAMHPSSQPSNSEIFAVDSSPMVEIRKLVPLILP